MPVAPQPVTAATLLGSVVTVLGTRSRGAGRGFV